MKKKKNVDKHEPLHATNINRSRNDNCCTLELTGCRAVDFYMNMNCSLRLKHVFAEALKCCRYS